MFISKIKIENFRLFGSGDHAFVLSLNPGLTALVGENDAGKTAVIDALRLVLGTSSATISDACRTSCFVSPFATPSSPRSGARRSVRNGGCCW